MKNKVFMLMLAFSMPGFMCCNKNNHADTKTKVVVTTIAGTGEPEYLDATALFAKFYRPRDVAVQPDGTLFITDELNRRLRKLAVNGLVYTFAGDGNSGTANGTGMAASFREPTMITQDLAGNMYVLDGGNPQVRKITPSAEVSVYSGSGVNGFADGPAGTAKLSQAWGIAIDKDGNIFFTDTYNYRIRKINTNGEMTTIAGTGIPGFADGNAMQAQFKKPYGLAIDKQGNLYVADNENFRIRKITPAGMVSTLAGSGIQGMVDGEAAQAQFHYIQDIAADNAGNLYVTDLHAIRTITPTGEVITIAGDRFGGFEDGPGSLARFRDPTGLTIDVAGNLYVADFNNHRIRKISFE